MDTNNLMIYGGGNTEIAAALEEEMKKLYDLKNIQGKIYAKHYLLNNSSLTTYKRFTQLKDTLQMVKSGGVYEYSYKGSEDYVKTQTLKMDSYGTKEAFRAFLEKGIEEIGGKQMTLVIISQNCDDGLLLDLYGDEPLQLSYKCFCDLLEEVAEEKEVGFHLILDIPIWHGVTLPCELAQINAILSLFIWEREEAVALFPLAKWLKESDELQTNWLWHLHNTYKGYSIIPNKKRWQECKVLWEQYLVKQEEEILKQFIGMYSILVKGNGPKIKLYENHFQRPYRSEMRATKQVSYEHLQDYFEVLHKENISPNELMRWFTEVKKCINYYKM